MSSLSIGLLWCVLPAAAGSAPHSIEDLQALEKRQAYHELLDHLGDIAPAERNQLWLRLLKSGADGWAQVNKSSPKFAAEAIDLIDRYPRLAQHAPFMKLRSEYGRPQLAACFADAKRLMDCRALVLRFVAQDEQTPGLAAWGAGLVQQHMAHRFAVPLYFEGITRDQALCKNDAAWRAVDDALATYDADDPDLGLARNLAFKMCFEHWRERLISSLVESPKRRQNSCSDLLKLGVLSGLKAKKCQRLMQ